MLGTDTGVGKTVVVAGLARGLRALGRRVWLWKPVACGGWRFGLAEDPRRLGPLVGDGQEPASLCRHQWSGDCAPVTAAARAGVTVLLEQLVAEGRALQESPADLIVEGAGGVLSPLTADGASAAELFAALGLPALLVTSQRLGSINQVRLSSEALRRRGVPLLGLVLNVIKKEPGEAPTAVELAHWAGAPVLAGLAHAPRGASTVAATGLAAQVLAAASARPCA